LSEPPRHARAAGRPAERGNIIIAITEENNQLFPDRPVTAQRVAVSTGLMHLGSAVLLVARRGWLKL
jgi:hypothetical protein